MCWTLVPLWYYCGGMERRAIHLTDAQLAWLKREAKRLGITIADLVRRIIDMAREAK